MTTISTIDFVTMTNISSLVTTNYGGVEMVYDLSNPLNKTIVENSFLTYSTVTTYDITGMSNLYYVDISGAQNHSTIVALSNLQTLSTTQGISTLEGISTIQGLSSIAAIEIDIHQIMNSHNIFLEIEEQNKTNLNSLDFSVFKTTLYKWAALNYPDSFLAYSFPVTTPPISAGLYPCSDGNPKNIWDYIPYCLKMSIPDWLSRYQAKVSGITLSFSVNADPYYINIHVTRSSL
jgi:hypothetical protein